MSERIEPWPVGTRVVVTWAPVSEAIGLTGTCMAWAGISPGGSLHAPAKRGQIIQLICWDYLPSICLGDKNQLERTYPVEWLRPIEDPDPVRVEREEELPA